MEEVTKHKHRGIEVGLTILIALYAVVFLLVFPVLMPTYHQGVFTIEFNGYRTVANGLLLILCIVVSANELRAYRQYRVVSTLILFTINVIYFLPGFIMNCIYRTEIEYSNAFALFWIVFSIFGYINFRLSKNSTKVLIFTVRNGSYQWFYKTGIVLIFSIIVLIISIIYGNLRLSVLSAFDLNQVLEVRQEAAEDQILWYFWYPVLCASLILPSWLVLVYREKRYWMVALIVLTMFAMYTISANRMFLLNLLIGMIICLRKDDDMIMLKIVGILIIITMFEYLLGIAYPITMIFRRLIITPNSIGRFYFDFFSEANEPDYSRQLMERWFSPFGFISPYSLRIPSYLGQLYWRGSNLNNGMIGYSMANFGKAGIIIGPMFYSIFLRIFDVVTRKIQYKKLLISIGTIISIKMIDSSGWIEHLLNPTWLLLYVILIMFMPPIEDYSNEKCQNRVSEPLTLNL